MLETAQGPLHMGFRTHVSGLKINTACTAALDTNPAILGSAPSRPRILVVQVQLFLALLRLPATSGQLSSPVVSTRPRYLNDVTVSNGFP